ncbi:MAG TPA: UDP-N-acetylglucosamine 2-epimerase (non-hydrolyzing) [Oligoflexia bacterium]|nr:UDP-N-acetylglucosamine 2-epimerase (non-hydrolyzing) [Oligoflexia bacterium]HMP47409.1 UDP-N-acetylglucosamine 2-epimerase (non-hydrolyzing) [Oligoflexia bacterium]
MKKIALIFGTRPEAIKLAPVYFSLKKSNLLTPLLWVTGQHQEMLLQTLESFGLTPEKNLELMSKDQSLSIITGKVVDKVSKLFESEKVDAVIVQGDTTSAFAVSLAAFYHKIPVIHVEAGLRTKTKTSPFPEELNRRLVSQIADYHFAPTAWAKENLLREGVSKDVVWQTGNTVIDALQIIIEKVRLIQPKEISSDIIEKINSNKKIVLITGHRRESFGDGFESLCEAIRELSLQYKDFEFIYPAHLNPNVQEPVYRILSGHSNILLTRPLGYEAFVWLMDKSYFILSDSGGIQEEAPHLGKPVLVLRDSTERPEAIEAGTSKLVGTDKGSIIKNASLLLSDSNEYQKMSTASNPYGDGTSSEKIRTILEQVLG